MIRYLNLTFFALFSFLSPAIATPPERLIIGAEDGNGILIVDPAAGNKVLWKLPVSRVHDLHLLPDFHILSQDNYRHVIEIDLQKKIHWSYQAPERIQIHSYQRLPGGITMISESGASRLIEVNQQGKIVKQFPFVVTRSREHSDTRLVRKLKNGHYLVAHEADYTVKEYDQNGKVVWEYKIPLFGKSPKPGHGPESFGGKCFSAIKVKNDNYLISTGNGHSVIEVTPGKEIVWKLDQRDIPGIVLAWVTNISERPDGNLIIGNCHAGPDNPQIIEITRDKKLVWSFDDHKNFGNGLSNTIVLDGEQAIALRNQLKAKN